MLAPNVAVEVENHVFPGRPPARAQRYPLSGKVRQKTAGVEAEIVIARAPLDRGRRGSLHDKGRDPVPVLELTRHGEARWPRPDDDDVGTGVLGSQNGGPLVHGSVRNTFRGRARFIGGGIRRALNPTHSRPVNLAWGQAGSTEWSTTSSGTSRRLGVDYIFGVDGANIEDLYDAAYFRSDITAVLAKHEFSAATMADGYSRSGAGLGVVAATSGGGALNLVAGPWVNRWPAGCRCWHWSANRRPRWTAAGSFQDTSGHNGSLNAEALFSEVSVFCRRVLRPADIVSALTGRGRGGADRRAGGVVAAQGHSAGRASTSMADGATRFGGASTAHRRSASDRRALQRADGPVTIIAGEQVARDDARAELERCARCCARGWPPSPTPKMSPAHRVSVRRRRSG